MLMGVPLAARLAFAFCSAPLVFGQTAPLLDILREELDRNFAVLKVKGEPAAYYLAYAVTEDESEALTATFGALQGTARNHSRFLDVTLRLGSPQMDNYRRIRGERVQFTSGIPLPVDNNPNAIQRRLWSETDRVYRLASQRLIRIRSNEQTKLAAEDPSPDFSGEEPSVFSQSPPALRFNAAEWEPKLRKWSALFLKHRGILASQVNLSVQRQTKYLVTSEGTRLEHGRTFARLSMAAQGKASDGMDLVATGNFEAFETSRLPKDDAIAAAVERVANDLTALLKAPAVDPFVGPAILSGRAAGVFFHEIFGHRIEGHRQKDESEGQTFTKSVNQPVLPPFLSVLADPTRKTVRETDLNGHYLYDDEGVKARPVTVVENGILKTFLMSRSPVQGFPKSNGHGRRQPGLEVVSRQSNLIVESARQVPEAELRKLLIAEIQRQGKPYGLFFQEVTGGFTTTARQGLQAFTVIPLIVYRVYPDGRPDELVRGVDIVGTPLAAFSKVVATSDTPGVFNGVCGAESGSVPVSAVSPALLVSEIEVQRKGRSQDRPPYLPRPTGTGGGE